MKSKKNKPLKVEDALVEKKKVGRPKKEIDYAQAEKLANMFCTMEEIAAFFDVSVRTLERDEEFCRIYKIGKNCAKMSLRRKQFNLADKNPQMAIFLGKQYLGQTDKIEQDQKVNVSIEDYLRDKGKLDF